MADYSLIKPSVRQIYEVAKNFRHDCLENDGSLLFQENIWTLDNLNKLKHDFIDSSDEGSDKFIVKLEGHLKDSPREVIVLAAEAMAVYYLFPSSVGVQHKRNTVSKILSWAREEMMPEDRPIYKAFETSIGNPGIGYNHAQFWELSLVIILSIAYKTSSPHAREKLTDPWAFCNFINGLEVPHNHKIQGRNILCHLFYPEYFERITTTSQKVKIIQAFTGQTPDESDHLDEQLLAIRKKQEGKYPGKNLDFYEPPLNKVWGWDEPKPPPNGGNGPTAPIQYTIKTIIDDGCFIDQSQLKRMLERLGQKKNLILQGPPGTGKTWLAKRLAYALMGEKNSSRIKAVQFHPNLAYEDFVRGWRPCGDGKLKLEDGPFLKLVAEAQANKDAKYVMVIEEINRGQPSQIFGEMLTLLEADKRKPEEAMELCHCKQSGETVYVPENLYVIGTMNIADRSLALVDLALRRRFAFIDLEPLLDDAWIGWMKDNHSFDSHLLEEIQAKMLYVNKTISDDANLGAQFRIGHSFVTPPPDMDIDDGRKWFRQVVTTEIRPQLEEYWFDAPQQVTEVVKKLLEGF